MRRSATMGQIPTIALLDAGLAFRSIYVNVYRKSTSRPLPMT